MNVNPEAGEQVPDLSIVIPAWNEAKRITTTLEKLDEYLKTRNIQGEVLVVDDGSKDDTREVVLSAAQRFPYIQLVTYGADRTENHGKGYAVKFGMLKATGKIVLFADADGSTPFESYDNMRKLFQEGYDVVIGSRYIKGSDIRVPQPFMRRVLSRAANKLIQVMILWGIKDTQCGFKAFTHQATQDIFSKVTINKWAFDMEALVIAKKHKHKIVESPVSWDNSADTRVKFASDAKQTLHDLFYIKWKEWHGAYDPR